MPTDYTLIVRKIDNRRKDGFSVKQYDYKAKSKEWMEAEVADLSRRLYPEPKFVLEFVKTYREVTNMMTGKTIFERFDTPYACSVSNESYWSN